MKISKNGTSVSGKQKVTEDAQEPKEETVKMNINLPRSFYKKVKQKALDEDTTITELVTRIVGEYVSK